MTTNEKQFINKKTALEKELLQLRARTKEVRKQLKILKQAETIVKNSTK